MHELKKFVFFANQKFSIYRKFFALPSKTSRFRNQKTAHSNNFLLSSKTAFSRTKNFLLHKPFLAGFKNHPFSQTQSLSFAQTFPYSHQKQSFSTLRCPFQPPLTYCPPKNTAVLLISALILCCKAGASHRFKSLPAIPGEVAAFCKTGYLMSAGHFSKNLVSTGDLNRPRSPEVRKPLVYFWFFSYKRKARKTSLSQEASRFCKPRNQRTAMAASHRNN